MLFPERIGVLNVIYPLSECVHFEAVYFTVYTYINTQFSIWLTEHTNGTDKQDTFICLY